MPDTPAATPSSPDSTTQPKPRNLSKGAIILLGTLTAIGSISIDMYLPGFPAIERDLHATAGQVQWTLASFFIGLALGQLFYGPISDRFGRKPPMYVGMMLYALACVGCMMATSIEWLIACRFVQALGGCAGMVVARAVVRDRCEPREAAKVFALLMLTMGLAPILAPLLGGSLVVFAGWRVLFAVQLAFAVICLLGMHFGLTESHNRDTAQPLHLGRILGSYFNLLQDRWFVGYTLASGLGWAGMFAYITGSPYVLITLHGIKPEHFGWVFGSNAFGMIFAAQINSRLLKHFEIDSILRRALWVPMLAGIALAAVAWLRLETLTLLLSGLFCFVASLGFVGPNGSASAMRHQGQRAGLASALMGSLQFVLATVVGTLMGAWQDPSARPLTTLMAVCGILAFTVHRLLVVRVEDPRNAQPH
ncbi:Bcr/CflA family multidrug efflux MFS transporter [Amantichitinum ursilacus]|uniref:Bcr/CflA family efflux transporter n=1 Tax=Amantichitinum ursilacus TaxID=857265 RepID=A0A0N1JTW5_9NEIS|nr:Bcr/CflA family multidrug efflux MFS transporter [Amantichitinum ursilacus]KPC55242.1 Bicyclomycin resistance protein [Amantichitinum ursilacus]